MAACFQTSSSSLPSITGGLSKRGTRMGLAFSGGTATLTFAALDCARPAGLDFAAGVGEGVAEEDLSLEVDEPTCERTAAPGAKSQSAHVSKSSRLTVIRIYLPPSF